MSDKNPSVILSVGTYPPRECGIATFTRDITSAIQSKLTSRATTKVLAINRNGINIYNYPREVIYQLNDSNIQDYVDTAKKINKNTSINLISIQHEFGIFGGEYGNYIIPFLEILKKPVVVTFHSVLPDPDKERKKVVQDIAKRVKCIIVMTEKAVDILRNEYDIKTSIKVIPHGIPSVSFEKNEHEKERLNYKDRIILSSFGLLSKGKGYQYVIQALPKVIKRFPNLLYLIMGETHPVVRKEEGEKYRNMLEKKVKKLGLEKNVKFYNKYLTLGEIIRYLKATDIYISPSLDPNQITSGTLVYAMGCGRPVISTPFLHAKDIVTRDRGNLVKFRNPKSFADSMIRILSDPELKKSMQREAYSYTRHMTWSNVALSYLHVFKKYTDFSGAGRIKLPEFRTDHMKTLTDDFGMIQFAKNTNPDISSGYTLDDNARAMIISCADQAQNGTGLESIRRYLGFIGSVQKKDGKLYNIVDQKRKLKDSWSEDAHGRALWALGNLIDSGKVPLPIKQDADLIFRKAKKQLKKIKSPRAIAFSILGLHHYNREKGSKRNIKTIKRLADTLLNLYTSNSSEEWHWFEPYLTYSNAKLPEALLVAYSSTKNKRYLDAGLKTLDFLRSITIEKNTFAPVGQNGWYIKDGKRAYFDQQPVDAASMVQALVLAYGLTGKNKYKKDAKTSFKWFLGKNSLNQMVYDEYTGGCYDGVGKSALNLNQGAESTIAYLLARVSLENHNIKYL